MCRFLKDVHFCVNAIVKPTNRTLQYVVKVIPFERKGHFLLFSRKELGSLWESDTSRIQTCYFMDYVFSRWFVQLAQKGYGGSISAGLFILGTNNSIPGVKDVHLSVVSYAPFFVFHK